MKDFEKIDWKQYNKPPYLQQWLCRDDTLKLATFGDKGLAEVDDQVVALKDQWDLDRVSGHFLERIGKILNEKRNGNADEYYRVMLKLRRLLNTNDGSIPSIIKAIKFIYTSEIVHIVPDYPAGLIIEHDGEGTPGLNFNKLLSEIIPAGVSFSTRELFYFVEEIFISDLLKIIVRRNVVEYFGNPIKYNGLIKYDGYTSNKRIGAYGNYDGRFRYDKNLKYNGIGMLLSEYSPNLPYKYSSGIYDKLKIAFDNSNYLEKNEAIGDSILIFDIRKDDSDNERVTDSQGARVFRNIDDKSKDVLDELVIDSSESVIIEMEEMSDKSFVGMRKHHFFTGFYAYNGSIKYDGMALIPLG